MLSEVNQSPKDEHCRIPLLGGTQNGVVTGAGRGGGGEFMFNGNRVSIWQDENILEMHGGDGRITI